jgi:hypothetical protein
MSYFSALNFLRECQAVVARYESGLSRLPLDETMLIGMRSAQRRLARAEASLYETSRLAQMDIVNYRIVRQNDSYPTLAISESLTAFQNSIFAVADSIVNGPKSKANFGAEIRNSSSLEFGLSYPGSVGFLFLIPNQRNLLNEGVLDQSSAFIREFIAVGSSDEARDASRHMGLAAVSTLYDWVAVNAKWDNDIDYKWRRSDDVWDGEYVTNSKFQVLKSIIENAIEPTATDSTVEGYLVGFNVEKRNFHLISYEKDHYSGKIDDVLQNFSATVSENSRYRAKIRETEERFPATGKIKVSYNLLHLELIS